MLAILLYTCPDCQNWLAKFEYYWLGNLDNPGNNKEIQTEKYMIAILYWLVALVTRPTYLAFV